MKEESEAEKSLNDFSKVTRYSQSRGAQNVQKHRLSPQRSLPHPHLPATLI